MSKGKHSWEVLISKEKNGDESSCIGIAFPPVTDNAYNGSCFCMLRGYNGELYERGRSKGASDDRKFREGDVLRLELDMEVGTLTYFKNGAELGTFFEGLNEFEMVHPAVPLP